jgi:hypothetical protein
MNTNSMRPLPAIAESYRINRKRSDQGRQEWIEGTLGMAADLAEARGRFPSNPQFGHWLVDNELDDLGKNDRAALINMAADLVLMRRILEETSSRSWEIIWNENRFHYPNARIMEPNSPEPTIPAPSASEKPKTPEPKPVSKIDGRSKRAALLQLHPAAYEATLTVRGTKHRCVALNAFAKAVLERNTHRPLMIRWLDGMVEHIRNGRLQALSGGENSVTLGWGFPNGIDRSNGPALMRTQFAKGQHNAFFHQLRDLYEEPVQPRRDDSAPSAPEPVKAAPPSNVVQLPITPAPPVRHSVGEPVVRVCGQDVFPMPHVGYTLDDACVAVDLAKAFWVFVSLQDQDLDSRALNFGIMLRRNFVELRHASSLDGVCNAMGRAGDILRDMPKEQRRGLQLTPINVQSPVRPVRYSKPSR